MLGIQPKSGTLLGGTRGDKAQGHGTVLLEIRGHWKLRTESLASTPGLPKAKPVQPY